MIIMPGKYLTRDKSIAVVRAIEPTGGKYKYTVLGIINGLGGHYWTSGGYYYDGGALHPLDLISRLDDEAPPLPSTDERPLTRREQFAMAAMQGFLANPDCSTSPEGFAKDAIAQADALIAELDKGVDQ